ncbi:hypothetical protein [Bacillus norwichensis]|uniref:Uncharacterized protein n=1 Tax=Bacillus norwichensis TaxID=2762217 RepID=A0ABR8VIG2_9BACI|nr:hypothetical protein [Bacillus norwichensis]MBD8004550.1 hypothetical protein [Bacillus norwichensis]
MSTGLDKQIYIYSVDTSSFYNKKESKLNEQLLECRGYKSQLEEIVRPLKQFRTEINSLIKKDDDYNRYYQKVNKLEKKLNKYNEKFEVFRDLINDYLIFNEKSYQFNINKKSLLHKSEQYLITCENNLEVALDKAASEHRGTRILRADALKNSNLISQFESSLTRSLGIKEDETSTDIIVVRAFRYMIFEDLMKNGFENEFGERYQYLTSSAGNIRNKKSIWIKTKVYNKIKNKLMCGLSIKEINKHGGMNLNKYNAYTALCNTASTPWGGFDITKAIVVPDFTTTIKDAEVDYIDHETYDIEPREMDIEINHVDGAGMYLPVEGEENKSFQMRMPFFKGLMIPFSYDKFIEIFNGNPILKDIYGKEHNVVEKGIKYIFTESQFKMAKFFEAPNNEGWKRYQKAFKKYGCEASICKESADTFEDKTLNYQVLQSLNEMKTEQIEMLASKTVSEIEGIGTDLEVMKRLIGADDSNKKKNPFQRAVEIYPQLINDTYSREVIKDKKNSLVKSARAGKLIIDGTKRTYIAPDLFALCEWLFLGIEVPNGLLNNGEVSCRLYDDGKKLDVLRSPHNFREHCVRLNVRNEDVNEWYITNDIYTSTKDLISKQLMFDVDGDDSLIVSDPLAVSVAEEHMMGIKPLQYKLASANKEEITNENLYKALIAAYSKAPMIGSLANEICKIWNSGKVGQEELDLIRILCFESNAYIDFAKTLWSPERPQEIMDKLKTYSKKKVPSFFKYAKDKKSKQVESINNSVVNQLNKIIPNKRIHFEKVVGDFNFRELMSEKDYELTEVDQKIIQLYIKENKNKTKVLKDQIKNQGEMTKKGIELQVYKDIRKKFLQLGTARHVTDVLIKYLYEQQDDKHKQTLWFCFGWEIVRNLQWNINGIKECKECHVVIENPKQRQVRCDECQKERNKENARLRKQRQREKEKMSRSVAV